MAMDKKTQAPNRSSIRLEASTVPHRRLVDLFLTDALPVMTPIPLGILVRSSSLVLVIGLLSKGFSSLEIQDAALRAGFPRARSVYPRIA